MSSITKVCKDCGKEKDISEFRKGRRDCKKCASQKAKDSQKAWYLKNKELIKERSKAWHKANPSRANEINKRYIEKNLEKVAKWKEQYLEKARETARQWRKDNPEKVLIFSRNRRARKINAEGSFTASEWKSVCEKYGNKCLCCGEKTKLTADHVIPLVKGGSNWISNIQPLCNSCNIKKHTDTKDYRVL
jgi:5-methylcytosine-specific restriction endonuclease McrA